MLAIAAFHDYEIWQMDVKTAFLNGKLAEGCLHGSAQRAFVDAKHPNECVSLRSPFMDLSKHLADGIFASMRKSKSLDLYEAKMNHVYMSTELGV